MKKFNLLRFWNQTYMNKENLNSKIWYRAIKAIFILSFIGIEIIGLFFAHSLASEKPVSYYDDLARHYWAVDSIPVKMTRAEYQFIYGITQIDFSKYGLGKPLETQETKIKLENAVATLRSTGRENEVDRLIEAYKNKYIQEESLLTKAVLSGIKPSDTERESVGKLPISDTNFQNLKSNVQNMIDAKIANRDVNTYVETSFIKFDQGEQIQVLKPYEKNLYKYSLIQRIGIYVSIPIIILIFFGLISRMFYYIFLGEKFLLYKSK